LKRGSYDRLNGTTWELIQTYSPDIAEQRYQANLREKGPGLKIGKDHELAAYIERTIVEQDCSPAAVYGYAMEQGKVFKTHISIPTIYNYIRSTLSFSAISRVLIPSFFHFSMRRRSVKFRCLNTLTPCSSFLFWRFFSIQA